MEFCSGILSRHAGSLAHQSSPPAHLTVGKHRKKGGKKSIFLPLSNQFGAQGGDVRAEPCAWEGEHAFRQE